MTSIVEACKCAITELFSLNNYCYSIIFLVFRFSAGVRKLFWALFDKTDLEAFEIKSSTFYVTQTTGETLFAFFNIVAILISLNMLIAMMSNSFQQIAVSNDILR